MGDGGRGRAASPERGRAGSGGLPGSAVARGALMTILGEDLGPGQVAVTVTDALGRAHTFTPLFAADGQINALLPCAVAPGEARLLVTVNGRSGPLSEPFQVASENFQLFTRNQKGFGPAVAENLGGAEPRLNSLVAPGQALALWGTGLGLCEAPPDRRPRRFGSGAGWRRWWRDTARRRYRASSK